MYDLKLAQKKHQLPMQFVWFQVISQSAFYHMIRLIIYTSYNIQTIQKNWFECTIIDKNFKWWIIIHSMITLSFWMNPEWNEWGNEESCMSYFSTLKILR